MKIIDSNNQTQSEALLNEYKGNIFEFLTGLYLAQTFNLEILYLFNINDEIKERLSMYEEFVRLKFPQVHSALNKLSQQTAIKIKESLDLKNQQVKQIDLIGKTVATNNNEIWGETDLALTLENAEILKISLKLSKDNSYTNTKSAGIKSFIEKYFSNFKNANQLQQNLNHQIDFLFNKMAMEMYSLEGLQYEGRFDQAWTNYFPELPGELNEHQREILFRYYSHLNQLLFEIINGLYQEDKPKFTENILALTGFSRKDIVQVTTFHREHICKNISINTINSFSLDQINVNHPSENGHFFEIDLSNIILQIRIKPMNKFTTASYKVNCSIKEKDK